MKFAPKHVVTMVVALSAAVVLAPVGVMAATGQFVNITDPVDSKRKARVGTNNTLYTESRPGVPTGAFNLQIEDVTDVVLHKFYEATAPKRVAITEATFSVEGDDVTGPNTHVDLLAFTQHTTGYSCGHPSGWTKKILRSVALSPGETVQQVYPGPPLLLPGAATGKKVCLGFQQTRWLGGTKLNVAVSGYTY